MPNYAQSLADRYRRRAYGYLILEHQRRMDDASLSDETTHLIDHLRPEVSQHTEEIYELFLTAPRMRAEFFETDTRQQMEETAHEVKRHYLNQHHMLIKEQEAVDIAHIVTMNFARLCHLNHTFRQHVMNSRNRGLFTRLFR